MHHSNDFKLSAVNHYLKNDNYLQTSELFNCKRTSLMRWVKRYIETGNVLNQPRNTTSYKVMQKHVDYALQQISKNKLITLEELDKILRHQFNDYDITPRWLGEILRDNYISRKRTKRKHFPETRYGKPISYTDEVKKLFKKIRQYDINDIISIDETSIKPNMIPEYCRNEKGKRCYYKSSDNRVFQKYTLIVAISSSGLIGYKLYDKGGINEERFLSFIKENILDKYQNKLLLFDNAKAHITNKIFCEIKKHNDYALNVAYTPKFNPIESYFSQLKHYLKLDSEIEFDKLKISLKNAFKKITKTNYRNYFYNSLDTTQLPVRKSVKHINIHKYKE